VNIAKARKVPVVIRVLLVIGKFPQPVSGGGEYAQTTSAKIFNLSNLIIVETCNPSKRLTCEESQPIILQFAAMRQCPLFDKTRSHCKQTPFNDLAVIDRNVMDPT
jgi:hypothetical protein